MKEWWTEVILLLASPTLVSRPWFLLLDITNFRTPDRSRAAPTAMLASGTKSSVERFMKRWNQSPASVDSSLCIVRFGSFQDFKFCRTNYGGTWMNAVMRDDSHCEIIPSFWSKNVGTVLLWFILEQRLSNKSLSDCIGSDKHQLKITREKIHFVVEFATTRLVSLILLLAF